MKRTELNISPEKSLRNFTWNFFLIISCKISENLTNLFESETGVKKLLSGENISSVKFQDLFLLHVSEKQ